MQRGPWIFPIADITGTFPYRITKGWKRLFTTPWGPRWVASDLRSTCNEFRREMEEHEEKYDEYLNTTFIFVSACSCAFQL